MEKSTAIALLHALDSQTFRYPPDPTDDPPLTESDPMPVYAIRLDGKVNNYGERYWIVRVTISQEAEAHHDGLVRAQDAKLRAKHGDLREPADAVDRYNDLVGDVHKEAGLHQVQVEVDTNGGLVLS